MSRYQKVRWNHQLEDEPVILYSEISDLGIETRKVDEYRDGRLDCAGGWRSTGSTFLSEKTMPDPEEIAQTRVRTDGDDEAGVRGGLAPGHWRHPMIVRAHF